MSDGKTLLETVSEASGQQKANEAEGTAETNEGISGTTTAGDTQSGGTPDYVAGVDISDIPEQIRTQVREKLSEKAKLLEKGYQPKFQEVAALKRTQDELQNLGLTAEEAKSVLMAHADRKRNPTPAEQTKLEKTLDKLIESAPYEQRPALEQMRKIIQEETNVEDIKKQVVELQSLVRELAGETTLTKREKAELYVDNLSKDFDGELISKYRDDMVKAHLSHRIPLDRVLQVIVPFDELKQAILSKKSNGRKPLTEEKRSAISSATTGLTTGADKIDVKSMSLGQILSHVSGKS